MNIDCMDVDYDVHRSSSDIICLLSACHQCTRLGLQGDLNKTLETLNDAQKDADKVSNLEQLWPELINVEALITEAQVRLSTQSCSKSLQRLTDKSNGIE